MFVYINLEHRVDRMEYMESMLSFMKLNYVRFSAIKPTRESLIEGEYNSFYDRSARWLKEFLNSDNPKKNKSSIGTFGCYLSHYFILKKYSSIYSSIATLVLVSNPAGIFFNFSFIHDTESKDVAFR